MVDSMEVLELFEKYEQALQKTVDHFKSELASIRAGRANPSILNKVYVDYYGTMTPLNQMSNISVPEARLLTISLWDASMLKSTIKAIQASDIGINPTDDGKVIRLAFPALTEERRAELVKKVKKTCEETKVVLRNERRDAIESAKKLKKDNFLTEDDLEEAEKEIQKTLDKQIASLEKLLKDKEQEIMEV